MAAMKSACRPRRIVGTQQARIGLAIGQASGIPAAFSSRLPGPSARIGFAVAVLVLDEFQRLADGGERRGGRLAIGKHQRVEQHRRARSRATPRRRFAASTHRPSSGRRSAAPRLPSTSAAMQRAQSRPYPTPSATRIAMRRVRMLPSPGRANSDSAGDDFTSGLGIDRLAARAALSARRSPALARPCARARHRH